MAFCGRSSVKMAGLLDTRSNPYLVSTFSASACTRALPWQVCWPYSGCERDCARSTWQRAQRQSELAACAHPIQVWEVDVPLHKVRACLGSALWDGIDQVARQRICAGRARALGWAHSMPQHTGSCQVPNMGTSAQVLNRLVRLAGARQPRPGRVTQEQSMPWLDGLHACGLVLSPIKVIKPS